MEKEEKTYFVKIEAMDYWINAESKKEAREKAKKAFSNDLLFHPEEDILIVRSEQTTPEERREEQED